LTEAEREWPEYYPTDCPKPGARNDEIGAYRAIKTDTPAPDDFIPVIILSPERDYKDICEASGLSVFSDVQDLIRKRKRLPGFRKLYKSIAFGTITPDSGLHMSTGKDSHITWWVYVGFQPHVYFKAIPMEG